MSKLVLITGGAGFIGSHLADHLLACGYRVRAYDNLDPQVHGPEASRPGYLDPEVELVVGDVRDPEGVRRALSGVDVVFHFASAVGVGQSMYDIARYTHVNNLGTAVLLEALIDRPVERLVLASSMSLYGEGMYRASDGRLLHGADRPVEQLRHSDWEVRGADGEALTPIPTPETKLPNVTSIYALSKFDQERMCLMIGGAYGIPTVALRFFNVYGTRQALSNPYTGVLAIFASRLLNNNPPMIFEDGLQQRDLVSVLDVARACRLAMESKDAPRCTINIASGQRVTVRAVAEAMASALGKPDLEPEVTASYRVGDVRHCFADISLAQRVLGYQPSVKLVDGIIELADWLAAQQAEDHCDIARAELVSRGLVV